MKLIVDTNKYSGNFEREMCAFATGLVGECEVGLEQVDLENTTFHDWWEENTLQMFDENQYSFVEIYPTAGVINDGMGGHYPDTPTNRELAVANGIQKMIDYNSGQRTMCLDRLASNNFEEAKNYRGWTKDACERTIASQDAKILDMKNTNQVFPASQSICIKLRKEPPEEVLDEFKQRVQKYAELNEILILKVFITK